jgi:hypothetical protein
MAANQPSRGRFPWAPVALAIGIGACIVALMLVQPSARLTAAPITPQTPAGFQTTEKLILTVNLPAAKTKKSGTLTVELLNNKGEIIQDEQQSVEVGSEATSHRFEFKALKVPADQVTLRCQFEKEEIKVPLATVLLVKAHETALTSGQEFFAGSKAALRCEVHGVRGQVRGQRRRRRRVQGPAAAGRHLQDGSRHHVQPRQGDAGTRREGQNRAEGAARH